ncbi:MAG TPA: hypothetical protein VJG49_03180, partial [Candidatus Nanoarchaeia archaeon]|nr:hypothetical protein [Candidatus Nanoarchaeia archaeon]
MGFLDDLVTPVEPLPPFVDWNPFMGIQQEEIAVPQRQSHLKSFFKGRKQNKPDNSRQDRAEQYRIFHTVAGLPLVTEYCPKGIPFLSFEPKISILKEVFPMVNVDGFVWNRYEQQGGRRPYMITGLAKRFSSDPAALFLISHIFTEAGLSAFTMKYALPERGPSGEFTVRRTEENISATGRIFTLVEFNKDGAVGQVNPRLREKGEISYERTLSNLVALAKKERFT